MAKTTTYHAQTPLIEALCEHYGHRLDGISKQDKLVMVAAIALYLAFPAMQKEEFWIEIVLDSVDANEECDESVREAIEALLSTEEDEQVLKNLLVALSEQISAGVFAKKS
jgi:hypothetical protein